MIKARAHVSQLCWIRSTSIFRWRTELAVIQAVAHVQSVRRSVWDRCGAAGELLEMTACGDVTVFFVLFLTALRGERDPSYEKLHSSDLTAIPEISSFRVFPCLWPMPLPSFPSSLCSLCWQELICTMCSLIEIVGGGDRALVEACEPDTTVNLHFHSVILSRPSSSSFSPFLCHSFFYWHVTHWTSWKLNWAKLSTSGEACQIWEREGKSECWKKGKEWRGGGGVCSCNVM